jgi:hypothetical protein
MAGSFGYEAGDKYDVSIKAGERVLLPAVREADRETLLVTDGFSCREQITQNTDRQALHLAQVILMAMREGEQGTPLGERPEARYPGVQQNGGFGLPKAGLAAVAGAGLLVGGGLLLRRRQA